MKKFEEMCKMEMTVEEAKINIMQGFTNHKTKEILDTKDEFVRNALIELGWTPPKQ